MVQLYNRSSSTTTTTTTTTTQHQQYATTKPSVTRRSLGSWSSSMSKKNKINTSNAKLLISYKTLLIIILLTVLLHTHISSNVLLSKSLDSDNMNDHNDINGLGLPDRSKRKQQQQQRIRQSQQEQQTRTTTTTATKDDERGSNQQVISTPASPQSPSLSSQSSQSSSRPPPPPHSDEQPYRKWAYVYLMGGVHPKKPYYRGYLYNILVSKYILEMHNSTADVVVMVQMSSEAKHLNRLPEMDAKLLREMNIHIHYLPKPPILEDDFYHLQLSKFQILGLTNYSRAFFLDADVMPFCNTDYMFELSEPPTVGTQPPLLKENVILAWKGNPAAGSYFMLKPGIHELDELNMVIARHEEEARQLPYPYFDKVRGWGHEIKPPDYWRGFSGYENRTKWEYHGDFADQGLLYYWTKYVKQNVSIVAGREIENWSSTEKLFPTVFTNDTHPNVTSTLHLEEIIKDNFLMNYTCLPLDKGYRGSYGGNFPTAYGKAPYRDFYHFVGHTKVWENPPKKTKFDSIDECKEPRDYWLYNLGLVQQRLNISKIRWKPMAENAGGPPLGRFPLHTSIHDDSEQAKRAEKKK